MSYTIDKLPEEPIVLLVHEGTEDMSEMDAMIGDLTALLDAQPEPVFLMLDIRGLALGLDNMTSAATAAARGSDAPLHHPNIRESLVVSSTPLVKLAVQGLRTATFGNAKLRIFETPEQALDYCREQIVIANNPYTEGYSQ